MLPHLKIAIENVLDTYYKPVKKDWDSYAFNKKPADHIFVSLDYLHNYLRWNRKKQEPEIFCAGDHEMHFLVNTMMDLKDSLVLSPEQVQWTDNLKDRILIHCLKEHPRTRDQILLKRAMEESTALAMTLSEGKQAVLLRIRNMLLTQNI